MAQLLCITDKQALIDRSQVGDIIGVFSDDWVFSKKEKERFTIVKVTETKADIEKLQTDIMSVEQDKNYVEVDGKKTELTEDIQPHYTFRYVDGEVKENYSREIQLKAEAVDR